MIDSIPGMFGFKAWYEQIAAEAPPGSTLVELGVFCGKSLAFLAEQTRSKGCRVVGVDTFLGSPEFSSGVYVNGVPWDEAPVGCLASMCVGHLAGAGVLKDITLIVSDAARAASLFPDASVWHVFVDAGHDADSVSRDLLAWWPKVQPGGWLAGDDYGGQFPGVEEGIKRVFPNVQLPPGGGPVCSWGIRKE